MLTHGPAHLTPTHHTTMTVTPKPRISAEGKAKLDALLAEKVAEAKIPAIFFGASNADGELYFDYKGDKVLGEPDKGPVTLDTSAHRYSKADRSRPALLADQVPHVARVHPALGEGARRL
jgi:hypothetical protein